MSEYGAGNDAAAVRPDGWFMGLVAGVIGAFLAKWLGNSSAVTAILLGVLVFLVYGVLLGLYWNQPPASAMGARTGGHDDAHGDHGHGDHGHSGAVVSGPSSPVALKTLPGGDRVSLNAPDLASAPDTRDHSPVASPAPVAPVMAAPAAPVMAASSAPAKPQGMPAPRGGMADALQEIEGIGPVLEQLCHDLGIYHFDQIAAWGPSEIAWMDGNLKGFKGRVTRDKWVAQAKLIRSEGIEAFRIRAKTNNY